MKMTKETKMMMTMMMEMMMTMMIIIMENSKIAKWRSAFEQGQINVGDTLHYKQMTKPKDGTSKKLE
eukprot:323905-Hanusia_phi.AAC.1